MNSFTEIDRRVLLGELAKARRDGERARLQTETSEHRVQDLVSLLRERGASDEEIDDAMGPALEIEQTR